MGRRAHRASRHPRNVIHARSTGYSRTSRLGWPHADAYQNPYGNTHADPNSNVNRDPHCDPHPDPNADRDCDPHSDARTNPNRNPHANFCNIDPHANIRIDYTGYPAPHFGR